MIAWRLPEFRARSDDRAAVDAVARSLKSENSILRTLYNRYHAALANNQCVDCGSPINGVLKYGKKKTQCEICKARGPSDLTKYWAPLYLEQSWAANNSKTMIEALERLNENAEHGIEFTDYH